MLMATQVLFLHVPGIVTHGIAGQRIPDEQIGQRSIEQFFPSAPVQDDTLSVGVAMGVPDGGGSVGASMPQFVMIGLPAETH